MHALLVCSVLLNAIQELVHGSLNEFLLSSLTIIASCVHAAEGRCFSTEVRIRADENIVQKRSLSLPDAHQLYHMAEPAR